MTQQQEVAALVERAKNLCDPSRPWTTTDFTAGIDALRDSADLITALTARVADAKTVAGHWEVRARIAERALATARADAFEEAAKIVKGNLYHGRYRQWPQWGPGNRDEESEIVRFADCLAAAIRAASNTEKESDDARH